MNCPKCKSPIKVPVAPAAQSVGTTAAGNPLNDLFDEEGFSNNIAALCPNCNAEMSAEAVLCTKCGFNKATGEMVRGHLTAGLDITPGALALERAAEDMRRADKLQRDMTEKAGMPWWMLGLILFILGSATALAVMALMSANAVEGNSSFNAMRTFLQLSGTACAMVSFGAFGKLVVEAFKENRNTGFLSLTVVYLFYFVFQKPRGRIGAFIVMLVLGGVAGGLLAQSQRV
ncbi:zinc ribbon domain-containing protein [Rhodopirellula sp. MGV]|uniref:zinc ribbon domain-containing protein n=1 Tax=Rhodopirellula sp. MGV TaxID=2023130 RepID=UPI00117A3B98|nr:zinc ribbon domain-containing protein [Rhodopirellula sp. MGV]